MEHAISFPALGLDFNINRVAVNLFGKDIYWYGIIICLGFVLAALYVNRRTKEFGVTASIRMRLSPSGRAALRFTVRSSVL